ncbi:MAG: hypothetical protein IPM52_12915 [Bacteroidetes bacterium]|nr:hypothetical protein [Bacteroidota bacterium]
MENNNLTEQNLVREISFSLSRNAGWIKFLGIVLMAYGVFLALSLVGLLIAWLPFWMGYLLNRAASKAKSATAYGDRYALQESLMNIGNYFIINGIVVIFSMLAVLVMLIILAILGFSLDPETFESILS